MKKGEDLRTYAQRWRERAAQVVPPLSEKEMVSIFIDTLKEPYYEKCLIASDEDFFKVISIGDRVDRGISIGRIVLSSADQNPKKSPFCKQEVQAAQYHLPAPNTAPSVFMTVGQYTAPPPPNPWYNLQPRMFQNNILPPIPQWQG